MKKTYIFVLSIIVGFGIIAFIFIGIPTLRKRSALKNNINIIIGDDTFWEYNSENKWITANARITFGTKKYNVYINKEYKGMYDIDLVDNQWHYFDNNNNNIKLNGKLFAYSGKRSLKLINYNQNSIDSNDLEYITKIFKDKENLIPNLDNLIVNQKIIIDIDNDGKDEYIYAVSNFCYEDCLNAYPYYSVAFIVDNKKISLLSESYNNDDCYSENLYKIDYIIDVDNDSNYEIVVSKSTYGNNKLYHELFAKSKNQYKRIVSSGG